MQFVKNMAGLILPLSQVFVVYIINAKYISFPSMPCIYMLDYVLDPPSLFICDGVIREILTLVRPVEPKQRLSTDRSHAE